MINSKPKNTYVQSLGSESVAFPRQLSAVASWNFRNILPSSSPRKLGGVKGKREREKMFIPLTINMNPFPSPHLTILGWQTTSGLPTQKCWVRIGERLKGKGKGILSLSPLPLPLYPAKVTWLTTRATDLLLLISPALLLGIDITLNPSLSKEFQGESR
ncbi:hypothetical protein ACEYW6_27320 [Nostoc sp. UIC 10607]|uniref:hypothetical protein n=1 Tax=Nostoc sp. UIC 10607 TaxID=3045935 RepID=UPI0039A327FB